MLLKWFMTDQKPPPFAVEAKRCATGGRSPPNKTDAADARAIWTAVQQPEASSGVLDSNRDLISEVADGLAVVDGVFDAFIGQAQALLHDVHAQHAGEPDRRASRRSISPRWCGSASGSSTSSALRRWVHNAIHTAL
jgi:hypothetical protein